MTTTWTRTIARISTGLFAAGLVVAGAGTAFADTPSAGGPGVRTVAVTTVLADADADPDADQGDLEAEGDDRDADATPAAHTTQSGAGEPGTQHTGTVSGTFIVTGSGAADDVVTDQPGRTLNLGAQNLPFSRGFTALAGAELLQIHVTSHGPASCKIVFGGKVVASNSGPFGADCVYQTI